MKGYSAFPKLQNGSLTIKLFSVISRALVGGSHPFAKMQALYSTIPADWALFDGVVLFLCKDAVGVFYSPSPSWLGCLNIYWTIIVVSYLQIDSRYSIVQKKTCKTKEKALSPIFLLMLYELRRRLLWGSTGNMQFMPSGTGPKKFLEKEHSERVFSPQQR